MLRCRAVGIVAAGRRIPVGSTGIHVRVQRGARRRAQIRRGRRGARVEAHADGHRRARREPVVRVARPLRSDDAVEQAARAARMRRTPHRLPLRRIARANATRLRLDDGRPFRSAAGVTIQRIVMFQVHRVSYTRAIDDDAFNRRTRETLGELTTRATHIHRPYGQIR